MSINILYEDNDLLIINKPSGITVNKAETTRNDQTVQDWAENILKLDNKEDKDINKDNFYSRGGIVHRIDKETSGVLILAKNPEAFVNLQKQFKERIVKKTYVALVHGRVVPDSGEINLPIGRLPWNRMQFGVVPGGRESYTSYKVISYYHNKQKTEEYSYLELNPKTGRTHQIRVHLKYIGYPIFADFLYAGRKIARDDRIVLERVFLHAAKIFFIHPSTGKDISFESPLPSELKSVMDNLIKD